MKFCMLALMFSIVSLPYSVTIFIGVLVESGIIIIFVLDPIHPDCFSISANFELNRLMDFDSPSNSSGSLIMALLKSFMNLVDV